MIKKLTVLEIILLIVIFSISLTGCEKKNEGNNDSGKSSSGEQTYNWSSEALDGYGVPKLEAGKITNINELQGEGSDFNYTMEVKDIKKSDLEKYSKKFDGWSVYTTDSAYFFTKSEVDRKSSVVITLDEENSTAQIVITVSQTK